eukprot:4954622-Prymnesium_polylepis.1
MRHGRSGRDCRRAVESWTQDDSLERTRERARAQSFRERRESARESTALSNNDRTARAKMDHPASRWYVRATAHPEWNWKSHMPCHTRHIMRNSMTQPRIPDERRTRLGAPARAPHRSKAARRSRVRERVGVPAGTPHC